jgi:hypothetical protein
MLPTIGTALGAELVRDGGSLAAFFVGVDGVEYRLFFGVVVVDSAPGYREATGYSVPVIIKRLVGTNTSVSWDHARVLLAEMLPLLRESRHRAVAESMLEVAKNDGKLTPGVVAQFEVLQVPKNGVRLVMAAQRPNNRLERSRGRVYVEPRRGVDDLDKSVSLVDGATRVAQPHR